MIFTKETIKNVFFIFVLLISSSAFASEKDNNPFGKYANEKVSNKFIHCVNKQKVKDIDACLNQVGRIEWYPYKSPDICALTKDVLNRADNSGAKLSWKLLFMNERCQRLGEPYYKR